MNKPKCFIIQPFDKGEFDELYDDVIEIAVKECGADCLRSDKILGAKPPLEKIQASITDASVCIAEVTLDNPNVFFEAGWAFALNKPIFVLWDKSKRPKGLPFDIHNKAGIPYDSSKQGWRKELRDTLVENIKFELSNPSIPKPLQLQDNQKFSELEYSILGILLKAESVHQDVGVVPMNGLLVTLGFTKVKIAIALQRLIDEDLIGRTLNMQGDAVCAYYLNTKGHQFIRSEFTKFEEIFPKLPDDYSQFAPTSAWGY